MLNSVFRNLKSFFIIFAGSIALASIILIFIFVKNQGHQSNTISFIQNLKEISVNFKNLNEALQNYKNANHSDDFYIYKHDTYSNKVYFYLTSLKNNIENLNKETSVVSFDISVKLNEILDILNDFESDFKLLNENTVNLGNAENGYAENIIHTEQKTDKILKSYPILFNHFQKLKKAKNNLLAAGNTENEEKFLNEKKNFLNKLKSNLSLFENTSEKQIVINNVADWINTVLQFSKLQKINGTPFYPGIYDNLKNLIIESQSDINTIRSIGLSDLSDMNKGFSRNFIIIFILFTVVFILIVFFVYGFITKKLNSINRELSESIIIEDTETDNKISEFEKTELIIRHLKKDIQEKTEFINNLKSEKLSEANATFGINDKLGKALADLKASLEEKENEQKKKEQLRIANDKHKDGIVKFGKIIRQHFGNLDDLTFNLLSELVHFLHADIGGIYIVEDKENSEILRLRASYAYNEKKILNKEIKIGEGLVGTCAADKSSIYIDKVDDDYIKIVSGFGHTKPKSLLLSPIFVENRIFGVIELASVGTFTPDDIKFTETLAEDIAYTLAYLLK